MANKTATGWSVLYTVDGEIVSCGPFATMQKAERYARSGGEGGEEFDCELQYVYLLDPAGELLLVD